MSIRVMTQVWDRSRMKGSALLLQLALADFARDDGGGAYPSLSTLSQKVRMGERQAQRLIRLLVSAREVAVVTGGGRGRANNYAVMPGGLPPERVSPVSPLSERVTSRVVKGDTAMSPQPSDPSGVVVRLADLPGTVWWRSLAQQYPHIDLAAELAKAQDWYKADKVKSPKLFFRNWVERAARDRPRSEPTGSVAEQMRVLSARMAVPA